MSPLSQSWLKEQRPALRGEELSDGRVRCHLSPRHCTLRLGQRGFCRVRGNEGGRLVTYNYGKGLLPTEETIETEAVYHYAPGEPILSLGNLGCSLNCDYCHNWSTSQAKHVDDSYVHKYSPEEVVATALRLGIRVLSWTYDDPVVWHEFVLETARLGRAAGLVNLYKSAFFIDPGAVAELTEVIDIFSVSLKTLDPATYKKLTKGWLEPVLESTRVAFKSGRHVEVSALMVTDICDDERSARLVADFVCNELSPTVPVHFVRFHPDYKLRDTVRTPIERLVRAREIAREVGVKYVYLGNVYAPDAARLDCPTCGQALVERFGISTSLAGLRDGHCTRCGAVAPLTLLPERAASPSGEPPSDARRSEVLWQGDVRALHVEVKNPGVDRAAVYQRPIGTRAAWTVRWLEPGTSRRWLSSQSAPEDRGVELRLAQGLTSTLQDVYDRAHFPTVDREHDTAPRSETGRVPLPLYPG